MNKWMCFLITSLLSIGTVFADNDRPDHYKGEPSENLAQAIANLETYSQELAAILEDELTPEKMAEVHQLSYTLENALERIDEDVDQLQEWLEEVHVGSEHMEYERVKEQGDQFVSGSAPLYQ